MIAPESGANADPARAGRSIRLRNREATTLLSRYVDRVDPGGKFGFIIGPNDEEYFFHQSAIMETRFEELTPGDRHHRRLAMLRP